jgi:hypothetical protein
MRTTQCPSTNPVCSAVRATALALMHECPPHPHTLPPPTLSDVADRLTRAFRPLAERYMFLDPDVNCTAPHLTGSGLSADARAILAEEFEGGMQELLLRGGFEEVRMIDVA